MENGMIQRMLSISLILILVMILGCGRPYHIQGRVIIIQGMAVAGTITEITGQRMPEQGEPVSGAEITVFYALKDDGSPDEKSTWKKSVFSDETGLFEINDYSVPSEKLKVGLRVSKAGFDTVYTVYWDYKDIEPQVFMVKMKRADIPAK